MTSLSDFPPDVQAAATAAHAEFASNSVGDNLGVIIANAIMADRAIRPSIRGLTPRQSECLRFISRYQQDHDGVAPSFREMADYLGLARTSSVANLINALEERGRIKRLPNRSRAITIITAPGA